MSTEVIERVFGRGRQKMATGDHVEVFREAAAPGERRRYTKRFLATGGADFRQWTDREWRILARLIGHGVRCVPAVVQYHGGAEGGLRELQTYDAGITVDQWATLLPVERDGVRRRNVFADAAHWWALAHHCLAALDEIHALELVHLDVKADNLCIPHGPSDFDPADPGARLTVDFGHLALIDFAFSLVSRERLATSLPIGWQKDYDYQSPRLLRALEAGRGGDVVPTQELDWRCDLYSLAAMLRRYLPDDVSPHAENGADGWTPSRRDDARTLVFRLRECHDGEDVARRPHRSLMELTAAHVGDPELARSIVAGWTLIRDSAFADAGAQVTPMTRIAGIPVPPTELTRVPTTVIAAPRELPTVFRDPRERTPAAPIAVVLTPARAGPPVARRRALRVALVAAVVATSLALPFLGDAASPVVAAVRDGWAMLRSFPDLAAARSAGDGSARTDTVAANGKVAAPATERSRADVAQAEESGAPRAADAGAAATPPSVSTASVPPAPGNSRDRQADANARSAPSRTTPRVSALASAPNADARTAPPLASPQGPPASNAERAVKPRAVAPTGAPAQDRALASLQELVAPSAAPIPYDPVAARRATARLAQQATRVTPSTPHVGETATRAAQHAPIASEAPAQDLQVAAASKPDPDPVVTRTESAPFASPVQPAAAPARAPEVPPGSAGAMPLAPRPTAEASSASRSRDRWRDRWQSALKALGLAPQSAAPPAVAAPSTRAFESPPSTGGTADTSRASPLARSEAPVFGTDAGRVAAPRATPPGSMWPAGDAADDLAARGRRIVAETVPVVAAQAWADAAVPLGMATGATPSRQSRAYADATNVRWRSEASPVPKAADAARGRDLYEAAHRAYVAGRKLEAVDLDLRALAANPRDPDVAGFLAFLHLRTTPTRPETARQLALHALAFSGSRRGTRFEDWNTFAVASALTGRSSDATRAYLLMLALSGDADRSCRAVLRAQATFGDALRPSVEALSQRIRRDGRTDEAPDCASTSW